MKRSDKFIEWMKDWFVYESMTDPKTGQAQLYRFYPLPTRRVAINVMYWDYDGGHHNHLWSFFSVILYGGYTEQFLHRKDRKRGPLSIGYIGSDKFHTLQLYTDVNISLMIRGKQRRPWIQYMIDGVLTNVAKYWKSRGYTKLEMLESLQGHYPRKWKLPLFIKKKVDKHINAFDKEKHKKKA